MSGGKWLVGWEIEQGYFFRYKNWIANGLTLFFRSSTSLIFMGLTPMLALKNSFVTLEVVKSWQGQIHVHSDTFVLLQLPLTISAENQASFSTGQIRPYGHDMLLLLVERVKKSIWQDFYELLSTPYKKITSLEPEAIYFLYYRTHGHIHTDTNTHMHCLMILSIDF